MVSVCLPQLLKPYVSLLVKMHIIVGLFVFTENNNSCSSFFTVTDSDCK